MRSEVTAGDQRRVAIGGARPGPLVAFRSIREIVAHRELLMALVEQQIRSRAKRAHIGTVYPVVAPYFLLFLYVFVFRRVFNVPIPRYVEFLFAGLLPWTFVTQSLNRGLTSLSNSASLIRRSPFPRELLPLSVVLVTSCYFVGTLATWVVYLAVRGQVVWSVLPVLFVPTVALILLVSSIAMVLAAIDVRTRDLRHVLGNVLTLWFFMLPILYRREMAPGFVQSLRSIDPMNMVIGQFRDVLHYGSVSRPGHMALMLAVTILTFVVSLTVFAHSTADLAKDV